MMMDQEEINCHKERIFKLQRALSDAYPGMYYKNIYSINDYKSLSMAALNECEVICQLLLDIEENRSIDNMPKNHSEIVKYSELVKKLEKENEFQQSLIEKLNEEIEILKQVPANRHVPRHTQMIQKSIPGQKINEILCIEKDIQLLKDDYLKSRRTVSVENQQKKQRLVNEGGRQQVFSQERLMKSGNQLVNGINDNKCNTIDHVQVNQSTLSITKQNNSQIWHTFTKQQLLSELYHLQQQLDTNPPPKKHSTSSLSYSLSVSAKPNYLKPTSSTNMHTLHRTQIKNVQQVQQELKELEKRHLLVVKDFKKMQDERRELIKEKETMEMVVREMDNRLENVAKSLCFVIESQNYVDNNCLLQEKIQQLKSQLTQTQQQLQQKDLHLLDLQRQYQELQASQPESQTQQKPPEQIFIENQLMYDYQLPRSPRINLQVQNKEVQCDMNYMKGDQKILIEMYGSMKQDNEHMKQEQEQINVNFEQMKEEMKSIMVKVLILKNEIVKQYIPFSSTEEPNMNIKLENKNDYKYYRQLVEKLINIVRQSCDDGKENVKEGKMNGGGSSQLNSILTELYQQFEANIDLQNQSNKNLTILNNQQNIFNELTTLIHQLCNLNFPINHSIEINNELAETKAIQLRQKVKYLKSNLSSLKSSLFINPASSQHDKSHKIQLQSLLDINQQQLSQILKLKKKLSSFQTTMTDQNIYEQLNLHPEHKRFSSASGIASNTYKSIGSPVKVLIQSQFSDQQNYLSNQGTLHKQERNSIQSLSPFKDALNQVQNISNNQQQQIVKSPNHFTEKKINYLNMKLKDAEKLVEKNADELREKEFMIKSLKDELDRKISEKDNLSQIIEDMTHKLNSQLHYIELLETANKDTQAFYQIQSQKAIREHEMLVKSLKGKEIQMKEIKEKEGEVKDLCKVKEDAEKRLQVLKNQHEREKKLVEEKVRQLTELQTQSLLDKDLLRENKDLKQLNMDLNKVIKEERQASQQQKEFWMKQIQDLKEKISFIEHGCAAQIMLQLKSLRDEVGFKVDQKTTGCVSDGKQMETVEMIVTDIKGKVNSGKTKNKHKSYIMVIVVKQRENLQKAVNILQSEKQQLHQIIQSKSLPSNPFMTKSSSSRHMSQPFNVAGSIVSHRFQNTNPMLDQSLPHCIQTVSPTRYSSTEGMRLLSSKEQAFYMNDPHPCMLKENTNTTNQMQENLVEYLQAEIMALREKNRKMEGVNKTLQNGNEEMQKRIKQLDIFTKKENIEVYTQLFQNIKEILASHQQEYLLQDICSNPLKQKSPSPSAQNTPCPLNSDDSLLMFSDNSLKLMGDFEQLMPLVAKCIVLCQIERDQWKEEVRLIQKEKKDMISVQQLQMDMVAEKENEDKLMIKQMELNYKQELQFLNSEKDLIVQKSKEFAKNLQNLQKENEKKNTVIKSLKQELKVIKEETSVMEERLRKEIMDKLERDYENRIGKLKDEAYFKGRKEASEEMITENKKLREIIDTLRQELTTKSKRLIEQQFDIEELQKAKKKSTTEIDELFMKLSKEREMQKDLQKRLDSLLQEVSFLKNVSRQMTNQL